MCYIEECIHQRHRSWIRVVEKLADAIKSSRVGVGFRGRCGKVVISLAVHGRTWNKKPPVPAIDGAPTGKDPTMVLTGITCCGFARER